MADATARICENCGTEFVPTRYRAQRFCSKKCNDAHRVAVSPGFHPELRNCAWCSSEFVAGKSAHRFCSRKCREKGSYRGRVGWPGNVECGWCSTSFDPMTHKRGQQNRYCSEFCRSKTSSLSTYNVTGRFLFALLDRQGGKCGAGCGSPVSLLVGRGHDLEAHIDHDHQCCNGPGSCGKCIRGILCPPCNQVLGWIEGRSVDLVDRYFGVTLYAMRCVDVLVGSGQR